jgi:hypothetical protein
MSKEDEQRKVILGLVAKVAALEAMNKQLFNRCMAVTRGSICSWCTIAKDCTVKLEAIKP